MAAEVQSSEDAALLLADKLLGNGKEVEEGEGPGKDGSSPVKTCGAADKNTDNLEGKNEEFDVAELMDTENCDNESLGSDVWNASDSEEESFEKRTNGPVPDKETNGLGGTIIDESILDDSSDDLPNADPSHDKPKENDANVEDTDRPEADADESKDVNESKDAEEVATEDSNSAPLQAEAQEEDDTVEATKEAGEEKEVSSVSAEDDEGTKTNTAQASDDKTENSEKNDVEGEEEQTKASENVVVNGEESTNGDEKIAEEDEKMEVDKSKDDDDGDKNTNVGDKIVEGDERMEVDKNKDGNDEDKKGEEGQKDKTPENEGESKGDEEKSSSSRTEESKDKEAAPAAEEPQGEEVTVAPDMPMFFNESGDGDDEDFDPSLLCPEVFMDVDENHVVVDEAANRLGGDNSSHHMYEQNFETRVDEVTGAEISFNLTPEEQQLRQRMYGNKNPIQLARIHCTACNVHLGSALQGQNNRFVHPLLKVLICKECYHFYTSGEFEKDEDGSELYCRWCGQGGQVLCCSKCEYVFCKKCIRNNFNQRKLADIRDSDEWNCFRCNPKQLILQRIACTELFEYLHRERQRALTLNDPEFWSKDHARCCLKRAAPEEGGAGATPEEAKKPKAKKRKMKIDPDYNPLADLAPPQPPATPSAPGQDPNAPASATGGDKKEGEVEYVGQLPAPNTMPHIIITPPKTAPGGGSRGGMMSSTTPRGGPMGPRTPGYTRMAAPGSSRMPGPSRMSTPTRMQGPYSRPPRYQSIAPNSRQRMHGPPMSPQMMRAGGGMMMVGGNSRMRGPPMRGGHGQMMAGGPHHQVGMGGGLLQNRLQQQPMQMQPQMMQPQMMPPQGSQMKQEWFEKTVRATARVTSHLSMTLSHLNRAQSSAGSVEELAVVHNKLQEILSSSINSLIQIRKNLRTEFITGIKDVRFPSAKPPEQPPPSHDDDVIFVPAGGGPYYLISQNNPPPLVTAASSTMPPPGGGMSAPPALKAAPSSSKTSTATTASSSGPSTSGAGASSSSASSSGGPRKFLKVRSFSQLQNLPSECITIPDDPVPSPPPPPAPTPAPSAPAPETPATKVAETAEDKAPEKPEQEKEKEKEDDTCEVAMIEDSDPLAVETPAEEAAAPEVEAEEATEAQADTSEKVDESDKPEEDSTDKNDAEKDGKENGNAVDSNGITVDTDIIEVIDETDEEPEPENPDPEPEKPEKVATRADKVDSYKGFYNVNDEPNEEVKRLMNAVHVRLTREDLLRVQEKLKAVHQKPVEIDLCGDDDDD